MRALLAIAVAATLVSSPAQAQYSTYTDRASYEAQLGTMVIDDYSNPNYAFLQSNLAMSAVLGETRYTSTAFQNWNLVPNGYYCAGCNGSFRMDFRNTTVSSGGLGVYGVGFDFFNEESLPYSAYITFGDGTTTNLQLASASNADRGFFGVTSEKLVATVDIGLANGGTTQEGSYGQDNLTIGAMGSSTVVPEPSTVVLLAAGLAGLGFAGRARRQRV
ncbi:PEP-CTERM sorting domain-containing protein [Gemmatimonas groenlandica]|uniref:PEP-CTERM sorting domain-containing protein n=1 Tax=Gemmatimonas groenlandica TaxID=2732249 RepID=A0A6M4IM96_9BACT|nr:PEP-CTERM sorting domain-containing protein [Gemmatimonas groenlandica]QJR34142.1 PEP-CTERM sorting domain-containing protein [Gemmatimonas groenlandica]